MAEKVQNHAIIDKPLSDKPDIAKQYTDSEKQEESEKGAKVRGLRISTLNFIFIVISVILTFVLLWITIRLGSVYSSFTAITDQYNRIQNDAMMVQAASDDLTEDVRLFVMTGERRYMNEYFEEANETKRRERAIEDLQSMGYSEDITALLKNAVSESKHLMELEYEAMHYAGLGYGYDEDSLPDEVRNYKISDAAKTMTDTELVDLGQELVFGIDYRSAKARISGYRQEFLKRAIEQVNSQREQDREKMDRMLILQRLGIIGITLMCLVLFITISRLIVHPLRNAVGSIATGKRIDPLRGTYEIKYVSSTYNDTYEINKNVQNQLHLEAERDELTGTMNRRGYHLVIERLSEGERQMAILVMDIDRFKAVNDTYGHITGDKMLQKVAGLLIETFRSSDYTARIGGDEFVVLMTDITPRNRETIRKKISRINEQLLHPENKEDPVLSLSVGCAFSSYGYSSHLFSQADNKMYEVKSSGGADIRFA